MAGKCVSVPSVNVTIPTVPCPGNGGRCFNIFSRNLPTFRTASAKFAKLAYEYKLALAQLKRRNITKMPKITSTYVDCLGQDWKLIARTGDGDASIWLFNDTVSVSFVGTRMEAATEKPTISTIGSLMRDVFADISCELTRNSAPGGLGRVHGGFKSRWLKLKPWVLKNLPNNVTFDLLLTGHSLGAAVATIAANDMALSLGPNRNVYLLTFGSPRVGDAAFAEQVVKVVRYLERHVNRDGKLPDLVTVMPPSTFGYIHAGEERTLGKSAKVGWLGAVVTWIVNGIKTVADSIVTVIGEVFSVVEATVKFVINGVETSIAVGVGTIALARCLAGNVLSTGNVPNVVTTLAALNADVTDIGAAVDLHDMSIYLDRLACPL